jgi:hypothetical protein
MPPAIVPSAELDQEIINRAAVAVLEVQRLAADQVAGAGHDIDGGDAAGLGLLNRGVADVDRIEHAGVRMNRTGAVAAAAGADVAVGVDQPRHEDLAGDVADLGAGGSFTAPTAPTARILPCWITSTPRAMGSPAIGMICAPE